MPRLTLFGSRDAPWRSDAWRAVDDRVRRGSSQRWAGESTGYQMHDTIYILNADEKVSISHLVAVERMDRSTFANFYGNLDIKTLGGAGFASQSHTHAYDLSQFHGLEITIQPSAFRPCKVFHLNIKTELPDRRKDYRNTSVVVYEYEFDASDTMMGATSSNPSSEKGYSGANSQEYQDGIASKGKAKTFKANWEDFKPTYRGRPVPLKEAKELNPAEIKEISIMCRSNFGQQEGDFNLFISDITAFTKAKPSSRPFIMLFNAWQYLKNWFMIIFGLRKGGGRGFIRL